MKFVSNKIELFSLLLDSNKIPHGFRLTPELVMYDVSLVMLGNEVPIPIIDFLIDNKTVVICRLFWVGQAYPCWISMRISQYKKLPVYDWSHLKQSARTSNKIWNGSKSDTMDLKGELL